MSNVHILSPEIISKIAAGEVIERPASVVKELLENSIDAHADSIEVDIKEAGKKLIAIKDTGTGIEPDDIENIFLRHATSKISSLSDLYNIHTLGFRGEALFSISAISDIILQTKTASNDTGYEIHLRGGKTITSKPISITNGTFIQISELFFNTPARKKFLKTDTTEFSQILNIFTPYTMLFPKIRFTLRHNEKTITSLLPAASYTSRISKALNLEEKHLIDINHLFSEDNIKIHLILGDINIQRTNKNLQFIFINDRPVQNRGISYNINEAYKLIMPPQFHPFFCAYITMPPEYLDVNVHPAKREVKIKDESKLSSYLRIFCEKSLLANSKAKQIKESVFEVKEPLTEYSPLHTADGSKNIEEQITLSFTEQSENTGINTDNLKNKLLNANYIGIAHKKYILFESPDSLLIIDQHAAYERVNFEKLKNQIDSNSLEIQHLIAPILLKINLQEMAVWEDTQKGLEKLGFSTTLWNNNTIAVHSQPNLITKPETAVRNILSEEDAPKYDIENLARAACRKSIMAGDELKKNQVEYLRSELLKTIDPFTCPHGRPTVVELPENFLNKQFLRT